MKLTPDPRPPMATDRSGQPAAQPLRNAGDARRSREPSSEPHPRRCPTAAARRIPSKSQGLPLIELIAHEIALQRGGVAAEHRRQAARMLEEAFQSLADPPA